MKQETRIKLEALYEVQSRTTQAKYTKEEYVNKIAKERDLIDKNRNNE